MSFVIAAKIKVPVKRSYSPGAKMGSWKCFRVQGFMIDPESIAVLKKIKLGSHDGNFFYLHNS